MSISRERSYEKTDEQISFFFKKKGEDSINKEPASQLGRHPNSIDPLQSQTQIY